MDLQESLDGVGDFFGSISRWIENRITSMFGSSNERELKRIQPRVARINELEPTYQAMSDDDLRNQTVLFRKRLAAGETLDDLLEEAFAVCREASRRTIGLRHYDVQMIGGMALHEGKIAEMMTGEGKTLVATLPAYLNALEGKGVHVVTVNDYLARRDMEWMGPIYMALGLTVGSIQSNMSTADRQHSYSCDVTYGTNNEYGFDYLRDNMRYARRGDENFPSDAQQSQGRLHYAIIDEVDNILIDEARTPLIIAGPAHDDVSKYRAADKIAVQLEKDVDFEVNEKDHTTNLTDQGVRRAEHLAGVESFYTVGNMHWPHLIDNALKARYLYKKDVNYVIKDGEIVIVDDFTGRLMEGRTWSDGLHQAVEAKENVKVKEENQTLATITLQNFFKLYDKISGMTGTAMTEASEFWKIYKLDVLAIPPNRKVQRITKPDLIYRTEAEKYNAVVDEIERVHKWDELVDDQGNAFYGLIKKESDDEIEFQEKSDRDAKRVPRARIQSVRRKGRPILVGTVSIQKSELISSKLSQRGIKHQVLNAKPENVGREAEIVAQAGRLNAVTIATNMAGRGTDIILGGNPETLAWSIFQTKYPTRLDVPQDEWKKCVEEIEQREHMKAEGELVRSLGGLHIIGTERHEARRIDLQLIGRCGRQGDPGEARFYLSLEDDLVRIFAGDWVKNLLTKLGMEDGQAIESQMVTRRIEGAQKKREEYNFDIRKNLLEYDEVMDMQRKRVYSYRQRVLDGGNTKDFVLQMIEDQLSRHLDEFLSPNYGAEAYAAFAARQLNVEFEPKQFRAMNPGEAAEYAIEHARHMSHAGVLDAVEENLSDDVPEEEWNWQALAKTANARWRCTLRDSDLKKVGRDNVADFLIEKAEHFCDSVKLDSGANLLAPNYGVLTACRWLRDKFGVVIDPQEATKMEQNDFVALARQKTLEGYTEREARFPVLAGLAHFTIRDQNGKRYDREGVAAWAAQRFGVNLDVEDLKNKQRREIEEELFSVSRASAKRVEPYYAHMRELLAKMFEEENVAIETLRANREEKIARNDRITSSDIRKIRKDAPTLAELCNWLNTELDQKLTVEELSDWDVLLLENRVESIIESRFNSEMRKVERSLILGILDASWKEHLLVMDHLKSSVGFRGYAQVDPKVEYKREGMRVFDAMWNGVFERVTDYVYRIEQLDENFIGSTWSSANTPGAATHQQAASPEVQQTQRQQEEAIEASKERKVETYRNKSPKVGRNDPCPCGSGKKYKNCCGKN
ncbi:MAG: SEC-C domain-containing protein [Thermoguttaceae bacterium]|nr:SEC-C domain-containing protein [Thermoguttaceae bacterium]MBQ2556449.1 SEC-C domain-containing protein [Thermoguttaceae bacterium]MBQ4202121.1 SEC-C domain-containing protein [Thermoguttaceae bacterium]MBQ5367651.1 SEC-C domain-containing protein [Thermoguttaceae bacterium]